MSKQTEKCAHQYDDIVDILNDYSHPRFDYAMHLISEQFQTKQHEEQAFEQ